VKRIALFLLEARKSSVRLYADVQNFDSIREYIFSSEQIKDEFRDMWGIIKEDLRIPEKYRKVKSTIKGKDLYVMAFSGRGGGDWILCLDKKSKKVRNVIMISLFSAITEEKLSEYVVHEIENKGVFEYEFEE
jgi:hypothetical protein